MYTYAYKLASYIDIHTITYSYVANKKIIKNKLRYYSSKLTFKKGIL